MAGEIGAILIGLGFFAFVITFVIAAQYYSHRPRYQRYAAASLPPSDGDGLQAVTGTADADSVVTAPLSGGASAGFAYRLRSGGRPDTTTGWKTYEYRFIANGFQVVSDDGTYAVSDPSSTTVIGSERTAPESDTRMTLDKTTSEDDLESTYGSLREFLHTVDSPNLKAYDETIRFVLDEQAISMDEKVHLIGRFQQSGGTTAITGETWIGFGSFTEARQTALHSAATRRRLILAGGLLGIGLTTGGAIL